MAITDKFNNTKTTVNPVVTTVSTARSIGTTSLVCTDLTGWPTTVHFVTYKKTATGTIDKTTQCEWKGIVAGSTIGTLTLKSGTDAGNAIGDFVEMGPTASWGKDLIDGITTQHNQDGTHAAITATSVTNSGNYNQTGGTFTVPASSIAGAALSNYRITRQNDTTNTTETAARILTGWGVITGTGATFVQETVTFNSAFTSPPIVIVTFGGDTASLSSTYGAGTVALNAATGWASSVTTTSFLARIQTPTTGTWSTSNSVFYQWIAIGV